MVTSWNDPEETTQVFDSERIEGAASGLERWYISPDGKSKEVLAAREIIERARAGSLSDSTLVWRDGLSDWTRLDSVPELMQAVRAFRASVSSSDDLATVMLDPAARAADRPSDAGKGASPSLPPVPPVPGGRPITSLPPLPALPGSPRPPTQTLSGAPLPPPPSLPPLPGARKSVPDSEKAAEKTNDVSSAAPTTIAEAAPSAALSARDVSQRVSSFLGGVAEKARPVVAAYSERAKTYLDRDYNLPKVGRVSGRILAAVGGGVLGLLFLAVWLSGDDEPTAVQPATSTSAEASAAAVASETRAADEESGLDLDRAEAKPSEPKAVSLSELKSLSPGEKPPEVTKDSASRSGGGARGSKAKEFDVYAAKSALSAAAAKAGRCKGPKGEGSVRVKIAPSGKVASVTLTTPGLQAASGCIEQAFRAATVPPFSGDDKTVYKKFVID